MINYCRNDHNNNNKFNIGVDNSCIIKNGMYNPHRYRYNDVDNAICEYNYGSNNMIGGAYGIRPRGPNKRRGSKSTPRSKSNSRSDSRSRGPRKRGYFKSGYKVYLIADATDQRMTKHYFNRLDKLKISKREQANIRPHITLMEILVNREHPDYRFIVDAYGQINSTLKDLLTMKYHQLSPQMYINSKKGHYGIMGDFMAKVYKASNSSYITEFRMALYKYLEIMLGKGSRKVREVDGKKYFVYSYNRRDLIAIPEYYHGKGNWTPHLSIVKLDKLDRSNPSLYLAYKNHGVSALISALSGVRGSIDQLNMSYHFSSLRISVLRS